MIEFSTPPPKPRADGTSVKWTAEADALRARPGEWALIMTAVAPSNVTAIKIGKLKAFAPAGAFEATARKRDDGDRFDVWARYVGTGGDES